MSLRDKPTPLDWLAVGARAISLGLSIVDERRRAIANDPWKYFEDMRGEKWTEVPEEFKRLVIEGATHLALDEAYWDGDEQSAYICRGKIGDEQIAWIGEAGQIVDGPYVLEKRETETYRALGERLWKRLGAHHVLYGPQGLVTDHFVDGRIMETEQMRSLHARMKAFLGANEPRSYLLGGPPGTGKSVAIRWLVASLGLTSVRIDLGVLARLHGYHSSSVVTSLETLLRLLRPRAMILDDLDRVAVNAPLLAFLELARKTCVVVIASANSVQSMMGAAVRPGRFDDIVRIERLDAEVLRTMLADDLDLVERMATLPAAYVVEFVKRRRVLGRDVALAELDELLGRAKSVGSAGDSDE
ncbi:MAG: AAA family ATPase [Kofleriaceae bacterium]